jgi:nanoRNase/pAp phosphatase (c-di-AMP/oligoRNAs hydrolase)
MRIVTRADFDGLVCGSIITLTEEIDSFFFVEPKFMQDGMVEIHPGDIIANLPYHPNCSLWFDHHITNKAPGFTENSLIPGKGAFRLAHSAARVVYEYYTSEGIKQKARGNRKIEDGLKVLDSDRLKFLLEETDKVDAALLSPEEVLHPQGYVLISMTIDGVRPQDEAYWLRLIELLRDAPVEEIMKEPEVMRRCQRILESQERLKEILLQRTTLKGNVIFTDIRGIKNVPDGNRFLIYTLFPQGNISLKITNDSQRADTTAISVGYNIFNSTSKVNVGALLKRFGGGGHRVVGSCRVPDNDAENAIAQIFEAIKEN